MTPSTRHGLTIGALHRLDDEAQEVWSGDEIGVYVDDGYSQLCRLTKCLFDMAYIENLPAVGNYSSDEEFEAAKQIPGLILTNRRTYTRELDRELAGAGAVGPAGVSTHQQLALLDLIPGGVSKANPVGLLPRGLVDVDRVIHDEVTIGPEYGMGLAWEVNNRYESEGGDPGWFTIDKDGLFTLRRYPTGDGEAVYEDAYGSFGVDVPHRGFNGPVEWVNKSPNMVEYPDGQLMSSPGLDFEGACSRQVIAKGDVFVRFTIKTDIPDGYVFLGLGSGNSNGVYRAEGTGPTGVLLERITNNTYITVDGTVLSPISDWAVGMTIDLTIEDGIAKIYQNGVFKFVSNKRSTYPMTLQVMTNGPNVTSPAPQIWTGTMATPQDVESAQPTVEGSWGAMTLDPGQFPIEGPWGAPTRLHPDVNNTRVELFRLGRDLKDHPSELPVNYDKYIEFWACARALRRDGPGQDLKLSQHYLDRFQAGVGQLMSRMDDTQPEYVGRIGHGSSRSVPPLTINLPYNYGRRGRQSGGRY